MLPVIHTWVIIECAYFDFLSLKFFKFEAKNYENIYVLKI